MRTHIILAGMIAYGLARTTSAQNSTLNPNVGPTDRTEQELHVPPDHPIGSTSRPANTAQTDTNGIREALRNVTQAALTKGGFHDLIRRLSDADRARLEQSPQAGKEHPMLDERIAQFQKDWQAKYNQPFSIKDKDAVYSLAFATITPGVFADNARLASERIIASDRRETLTREPSNRIDSGDLVSTQAHTTASVAVAAEGDLPAVEVPMMREASDQWKIDISDTFSAVELHDALLARITALDENREHWPSDVTEAARMVSHQILMAVMNIEPRGTAQRSNDRVLNPNAVR